MDATCGDCRRPLTPQDDTCTRRMPDGSVFSICETCAQVAYDVMYGTDGGADTPTIRNA